MQADEMLLLFGLVRSSAVARVLEIGGLQGTSAYNFLQALRCKHGGPVAPMVITVDIKVEVHRMGAVLVQNKPVKANAPRGTLARYPIHKGIPTFLPVPFPHIERSYNP